METDADRLAMIRGLGGVEFSSPGGTFCGLLEADYSAVGSDAPVDSSSPRVTARTSDLKRCQVMHGSAIETAGEVYVVRGVQPDGAGMTTLIVEGP